MRAAVACLALFALALSLPAHADDNEGGRWSGLFPGQAQPGFDDYWYVNGKGGIVVTDQEFDNDGTLYGLTIGRTWGSRYAFELELATDELDFDIDYGLEHRSIGINHLTINREPLWDPYFLIGVGVLEFDGPEGLEDRSGRDFMFNVGVGGEWELVVPRKVLLRADLRLRYGLNDNNQPGQNEFGDGIVTMGLTVPFGDGARSNSELQVSPELPLHFVIPAQAGSQRLSRVLHHSSLPRRRESIFAVGVLIAIWL